MTYGNIANLLALQYIVLRFFVENGWEPRPRTPFQCYKQVSSLCVFSSGDSSTFKLQYTMSAVRVSVLIWANTLVTTALLLYTLQFHGAKYVLLKQTSLATNSQTLSGWDQDLFASQDKIWQQIKPPSGVRSLLVGISVCCSVILRSRNEGAWLWAVIDWFTVYIWFETFLRPQSRAEMQAKTHIL